MMAPQVAQEGRRPCRRGPSWRRRRGRCLGLRRRGRRGRGRGRSGPGGRGRCRPGGRCGLVGLVSSARRPGGSGAEATGSPGCRWARGWRAGDVDLLGGRGDGDVGGGAASVGLRWMVGDGLPGWWTAAAVGRLRVTRCWRLLPGAGDAATGWGVGGEAGEEVELGARRGSGARSSGTGNP